MSDIPATAEEFYALRDDRTNRCSGNRNYQNAICAVYISSATASTTAGQTMLLVACNLLSRWCRKAMVVMPPTDIHPALGVGSGSLGDLVVAQMHDADPFGDFQIVAKGDVTAQVELCIGHRGWGKSRPAAVFINASGWLASISMNGPTELPTGEDRNLLGAIAAACLGVAQVFKISVEMPPANYLRQGSLDVFNLNWSKDSYQASWPEDLNVGNVLMVGAGSVGSSAAYCMRLNGLAGAISVVDKDNIKVENFNRSPLFGCKTVGHPKVDAIADFLAGSALSATPIRLWWEEFVRQQGRTSFGFDVWLPLANEFNVRLAMQHNVPPLMIHASTTSNWGVNHGRHIPGRDDCLADRFDFEVSSESLACSTGRVEMSETIIDAALPFVSLFAGLLVVADLVRAQLPNYPQVPNFALFDWYGSLDTIQAWDQKPRMGCICRDQGLGFHDQFNGSTKYRKLFRFS